MNLKAVVGHIVYTLKKFSPEILLGVGLTGVAGGTVLACMATLKADKIIAEANEKNSRIQDCVLLRETSEVDYTVADENLDRRVVLLTTIGKFIRLYGPSVTLMAVSIACILSSYRIIKTRNVALMAAYKLIEEAFSTYRRRVVAELGDEADSRFLYGEQEIEPKVTRKFTDKEGNEHDLTLVGYNLSGFARAFEAEKPDQYGSWTGSTQWSKVHEYNVSFLEAKERHFSNMLFVKGSVVMNDVYSELGFALTEAGRICGWKYKSDRGDGYISFRPHGIDGNWVYGQDGQSVILDFNVDGVIFDQQVARKEMK